MLLCHYLPLSLHHFIELLVHIFHILDEIQLIRFRRLLIEQFLLLGLLPPIHSLLLDFLLLFLNGLLTCTLSWLHLYFSLIIFRLNFTYLLRRCFFMLRLYIHPIILHLIPHLNFFASLLFHLPNLPTTIPNLILPTPIQPLRPTITILHLLPLHKRLRIHLTHLVHLRILIVIHHIRVIHIRVHILSLWVLRSPKIGRHLVKVKIWVHLRHDNRWRHIVLPVFMGSLRHDIELVIQIRHAVSLAIVLVFIGRPRKLWHAVVRVVIILVHDSLP